MSFELVKEINTEILDNYVIVEYDIESTESAYRAAHDLAIGQSVGNPNVRNHWENDKLFERNCAIIAVYSKSEKSLLEYSKVARVMIGFPIVNTDWDEDGIAHLLCQIMGGQTDIDHIIKCRVMDIHIPKSVLTHFKKPKYGLNGMRDFTNTHDKPFLGGIVKPKIGLSPDELLKMVAEMCEGGVNFIKEDEILSNPSFCSLKDRVPLISKFLREEFPKVVYCFCINADPTYVVDRAKFVVDNGGNGVHINIWSGLGVYNSIRKLDLPLFIHYQKSGDKVITHRDNAFGISWYAMSKLGAISGIDTIHAGMFGGYLSDSEEELKSLNDMLNSLNVVPALSCGMHPGLVNFVTKKFGNDYMANVGGAIHGHPEGTLAGAKAMRQAIDGTYGHEYEVAVEKWGTIL
jgi:ribulose-bisphosphate carboxylase large chain